jgi:two-component system CheB/CheR fusion protein
VTLLSQTEERLRESEGRLRSLVENMPQIVWRSRSEGRWTWASPQWTAFTAQRIADALDLGWLQAVHPEDRERVMSSWMRANGEGNVDVEHRLWHAPDGDFRNVHTRAIPLRNDAGATLEWLGTSTDVHDLLLLQQRQKILLAELQHRVRNSLGVIRAVAKRSAATSDSVESYARNLEGRIDALARAQSILTRDAAAVLDLRTLLLDELGSSAIESSLRILIEGPNVALAGKAAEDLSLAFHELHMNSIKYGALGDDDGKLSVTWNVAAATDGRELQIRWLERTSSPVAPPARRGFGSELIEKLVAHELRGMGRLEFGRNGMICTIDLPLSDSIRLEKKAAAAGGLPPPVQGL